MRSTFQPSRAAQVVAQVETDVEVVLDLNPVASLCQTHDSSLIHAGSHRLPVYERIGLSRTSHSRCVELSSQTC